ncbi:MAG TPA: MraY family glycosyltransferase [Kofleriaceae bacterium]|nr:MraY family glycosyltransferase [Kofleriaceae bacterium]
MPLQSRRARRHGREAEGGCLVAGYTEPAVILRGGNTLPRNFRVPVGPGGGTSAALWAGMSIGFASLLSFVGTLIAVELVRRAAGRHGFVDRDHGRGGGPAYRALPRVGGVGIAIGLAAGLALLAPQSDLIAVIALAAAALFGVGFLDDVRPVPAWLKLVVLALCAAGCVAYGLRPSTWPLVGGDMPASASWILALGWLIAVPCAINFVDGLDGLAAGVTGVAACALAITAAAVGSPVGIALSGVTGAAAAGFWLHNRYPARIFMGDGGAFLLGFMLGCASLVVIVDAPGATLSVAAALVLPFADLACAVIRRIRRRDPFGADANHLHHQLQRRMGHADAVRAALTVSTLGALLGLSLAPTTGPRYVVLIALACASAALLVRRAGGAAVAMAAATVFALSVRPAGDALANDPASLARLEPPASIVPLGDGSPVSESELP